MLWLCWTLVTEADRKTSSRKQSAEAPPLGTLLPRQQSLEAVRHLTSVANDFAPPLHSLRSAPNSTCPAKRCNYADYYCNLKMCPFQGPNSELEDLNQSAMAVRQENATKEHLQV